MPDGILSPIPDVSLNTTEGSNFMHQEKFDNSFEKKIIFLLLFLSVISLFYAMWHTFLRPNPAPENLPRNAGIVPTNTPTPTSAPDITSISQSHNSFGLEIFKSISKEENNKNVSISPSSIALALSMVFNGAGGQTRTAMEKTLFFNNFSLDLINSESQNLILELTKTEEKVKVSIANSIWAKKDFPFKSSFFDINKKYFNAEIANLDFSDKQSVNTINNWVNKNTNGKINKILDPPIPGDIVMYLINAIYFKGEWKDEFDKKLTQDESFVNYSGVLKKVPMMRHIKKEMMYKETSDYQAVVLDYGKENNWQMYLFLPKAGIDKFVENINSDSWDKLSEGFIPQEGTLLLPKFKIEYEKSLKKDLANSGMGIAFSSQADFSGLGDNLVISDVFHKTMIEVDEKGTEAAAVTRVDMQKTSLIEGEIKTFYLKLDQPFFYAITNSKTGEILFMGKVVDP